MPAFNPKPQTVATCRLQFSPFVRNATINTSRHFTVGDWTAVSRWRWVSQVYLGVLPALAAEQNVCGAVAQVSTGRISSSQQCWSTEERFKAATATSENYQLASPSTTKLRTEGLLLPVFDDRTSACTSSTAHTYLARTSVPQNRQREADVPWCYIWYTTTGLPPSPLSAVPNVAVASVIALLRKSQIPLRYLVRTSFEPASVMEFGREPAIARASSLLAS